MSEWLERMRVTPGRVSVCPRHLPRIPSGKGVGQADLGPSSLPSRVPAQNQEEDAGGGKVRAGGRSFSQPSCFCLQGLRVLSVAISALPRSHPQDPSHLQRFAPALAPHFLHHTPPSLPGLSHTPSNGSHVGINLPILDPIWLPHRVSVPLGAELFEGGVRYPVSASSHSFRLFSSRAHQKFSYQGHDDPGCQIQGLFSRLTPQ